MDEVRKTAEFIQNKLRSGYLDEPSHSTARALVSEIEKLLVEIRQQKHPLSLENRVKEIIKHLESLVDDVVMDFRHRDELLKHSNEMRNSLRSLS